MDGIGALTGVSKANVHYHLTSETIFTFQSINELILNHPKLKVKSGPCYYSQYFISQQQVPWLSIAELLHIRSMVGGLPLDDDLT